MILRMLDNYRRSASLLATTSKANEFGRLLMNLDARRLRLKLARLGVDVDNPLATETAIAITYGSDAVRRLAEAANEREFDKLKSTYRLSCDISRESCSKLQSLLTVDTSEGVITAAARLDCLRRKCGITSEEYKEIAELYSMLKRYDLMVHVGDVLQQALALRDDIYALLLEYDSTTKDKSSIIEKFWRAGFYRTDFVTGVPDQHERDLMLKNPDWLTMARDRKWLEAAAEAVIAEDSSTISMSRSWESDKPMYERNPDWIEVLSSLTILSKVYD